MKVTKKQKIYMDYASTTPVCEEAKKEMKKLERVFQNPSSLYERGVVSSNYLKGARKSISNILNAREKEVIFTGGGTEGNNTIIFGLYQTLLKENSKRKFHIITSTIEHVSVLEPTKELQKRGVEVTFIKPDTRGFIDPREIKKSLKKETFLVSIMYANNEIGTVQPIREITKVVRQHNQPLSLKAPKLKSFFHTDACQAANYLDTNVLRLGVDFMTLDSGKIYGPKGVGAIFKKHNAPLSPIIFGGGQEQGFRSGTENISLICGFAKALEVSSSIKEKEAKRLSELQNYFFEKLRQKIPEAELNGSKELRLPNNINICLAGLDAEFAVFQLDYEGIECSSTSACASLKEINASYVVEAISRKECGTASLRFSLGRESIKNDIDYCVKKLHDIISKQKSGAFK